MCTPFYLHMLLFSTPLYTPCPSHRHIHTLTPIKEQKAIDEEPGNHNPHINRSSSKDAAALVLPVGWKIVASRSKKGRLVYKNLFTNERISWLPTESASRERGQFSKGKKEVLPRFRTSEEIHSRTSI